MKISIIICFYQKIELLKCCMRGLSFNAADFDEVIIADDGSDYKVTSELKNMIAEYSFPIIHAWHERKGARRAACRNNGIRRAAGDYLIFLDSDFLVLPGTIRAHVRKAKPRRFLSGSVKYTSEEQASNLLKNGFEIEDLEQVYGSMPDRPIKRGHREFIGYECLKRIGFSVERKQTFGGHFSIFKRDIESINGYDENFVGWGGEDIDIAIRLNKAGFRGWSVIPTARVLHLWHPSDMGCKHWKEGANFRYFSRENISPFCENGLVKPDRLKRVSS
jgi:glycosyltransferase involved in cell wall biosynthesis